MKVAALGRGGPVVSRLCFGTLTMSPLQADLSPREGAELLLYAHDLGVTFADTADLYGTYPHLREALRAVPDFKISTKAYCWDEKTAEDALTRAFRGLDREYVDVFMLHEMESIHTLRGHEKALEYLNRQKRLGRIGTVGVSTHYVACAKAALRFGGIDVIHPIINRLGVGIVDGTREQMEEALVAAHEAGIGVFGMKALGGGHLIGGSEDALRYACEADFLDSVAVGMQSFEEIDFNCALFSGEIPDEKLWATLSRRQRRLLIHDWCEGCARCVDRCPQRALTLSGAKAEVDASKCVLCGYCASVCPQFCIKVV